MTLRIALTMLVAALLVSSGCRTYGTEQDFDMTAPWRGYQRIVVHTRDGRVTLSTADVADIRIRGTKHASGLTLAEAEEKLKRIDIVAEPEPKDPSVFTIRLKSPMFLGSQDGGASFDIQVPTACAADIETDNGGITVSGLKDSAILKTSKGEISIDHVAGDVRAHSRSASITAEKVSGDLTAETANGEIRVKAIKGNCELKTSNGALHMADVYGNIKATLANGNIRADVTPPEGGSVVLHTRNGSIHVTLPTDLRADLDLRTDNGVVQTMLEDVPLRVQRWSQNCVQASMNGVGGARIVATTSHGLITLETR